MKLNKPDIIVADEVPLALPAWDDDANVYPDAVVIIKDACYFRKDECIRIAAGIERGGSSLLLCLPGLGHFALTLLTGKNDRIVYGLSDARPDCHAWARAFAGTVPGHPGTNPRWHPSLARYLNQRALLTIEAAALYVLSERPDILPQAEQSVEYLRSLWHMIRGVPVGTVEGGTDLREPMSYC